MDEATLRTLLDDVRAGRVVARRRRSARCAGCRSPTSATRWSTTTARCARACPRPSTARARRPSSAPASSASCSQHGSGPVLLTRVDDDADEGRARRPPEGVRAGEDDRLAAADSEPAGAGPRVQRRHGRRPGGRRVRGNADGLRLRAADGSSTSASPACIACSPTRRRHRRRRGRRRRRHGGRARQRRRRAERSTGRRGADEHRLRVVVRRRHRAAGDARRRARPA